MSHARVDHRRFLLLAGIVLALLLTTVSVAQASFGEITRFGGPGLNAQEEGEVGKLTPAIRVFEGFKFRPFHVIGVEPKTNAVYVLEEYKRGLEIEVGHSEELKRFLRLQEFSSAKGHEGELLGHRDFSFTGPLEGGASEQTIQGIAVDPVKERLYFLVTEVRENKPEQESNVAAALYAFKTAPNASKELEFAPGTTEGVLTGPEALQPDSTVANVPLLQPHGITVDPETHEIVILAHICAEETEAQKKHSACQPDELEEGELGADHFVTQRVKENGVLGGRIVDTHDVLKKQTGELFTAPSSPVVVKAGASERLLANDVIEETTEEGPFGGTRLEDLLDQFPASESGTPARFAVPSVGGTLGPLANGEVQRDVLGGTLTASSDGKTLYGLAEVENEETAGKNERLFGISVRSAETLASIGWTGAKAAGGADECVLQPGNFEGEGIQLAAGSQGLLFALVPEYLTEPEVGHLPTKDAIIEFGEGGGGCPVASSAKIEALVNGKEVVGPLGVKVAISLTSAIKQGDALSTKWTIENEETHVKSEETTAVDQFQHPLLKHEFTTAGKYKITEQVQTDNLETPTLTLTRSVQVEGSTEAPAVVEQPKGVEVLAGATAKFTATAKGKPTPSVQWLVSHNKGVSFEADTEDKGTHTGTLEVATITGAKSGNEYEAEFSNGVGSAAVTSAATLTVSSAAPVVTKQPASTTVTAGATASFSAAASGGPAPTIQWEVSVDGGATWTAIAGATNGTLAVSATTVAQSGSEYRALFSNGVGTPARTTAATLTVDAPVVTTTTTTSPGPPPPPPPPPGGAVEGFKAKPPTAVIAGASSLSVSSSGVVTLKVSCPAGATTCIGSVTLRTASAVAASAHLAKSKKKAILTLAVGSFSVSGGQSKTVTLHLSAAARKLLAHSHVLAAKATVAAHDSAGDKQTTVKTLSLHLAKAKKRK
jgi:Immunoglobulin I-set domain